MKSHQAFIHPKWEARMNIIYFVKAFVIRTRKKLNSKGTKGFSISGNCYCCLLTTYQRRF
uniref:Uncharacterized protein n=1 Tax=Rhizophora mucronata TaxID=61149 RepID=A0A2P2NQJ0_RHIMU